MSKKNSPTRTPDTAPQRLVALGEIATTHGIRGWLKVNLHNPETGGVGQATQVILDRGGVRSHHRVQASRPHKRQLLIKLEGIERIEDAASWVGSTLAIAEETLQPLRAGEYYYYQVLGLDVFNAQGQWVGVLTTIWSKKGGDLYVVQGRTKEHLIPAVKEVIEKIDLVERKIIINPPPGLLDL